jgi:UDP-N-acetylmuramate dehydrogenase
MTGLVKGEALLPLMPKVRGRLEPNFPLADLTWFRTGGPAEILFTPADVEDLSRFLAGLPPDIPVYPIGVGSNLLVRDGGVKGVVIRLGRGFGQLEAQENFRVLAGAAVPDVKVARFALDRGIAGLTFLRGIPGTIGGALRMNGGAYGGETKDVLVEAYGVDRGGRKIVLANRDMQYAYRHCGAPDELIFTAALLQGEAGDAAEISAAMEEITNRRESTQPVRTRTGAPVAIVSLCSCPGSRRCTWASISPGATIQPRPSSKISAKPFAAASRRVPASNWNGKSSGSALPRNAVLINENPQEYPCCRSDGRLVA